MRSPRELAVLMLANDCAEQIASREELEPHLERQITLLEQLGPKNTTRSSTEELALDEPVRLH